MNTTALIAATNELLDTNESRLSVDTWVQIVIAIITLVAAVIACYQSHKANTKSAEANRLASEANRISKATEALSMNLDLLDRRKDILERIEKCKPSEMQLEDLYVRIIPEKYDDVSSNEIQLLFLDNEPIKESFRVFNIIRAEIKSACNDMNTFHDLCESNNPGAGGIIWKEILKRYYKTLELESNGISTDELEAEFQRYCHEYIQAWHISDQISEDYDFYDILKKYDKSNFDFKDAKTDLCTKIRGFIKDSIDPTKI